MNSDTINGSRKFYRVNGCVKTGSHWLGMDGGGMDGCMDGWMELLQLKSYFLQLVDLEHLESSDYHNNL